MSDQALYANDIGDGLDGFMEFEELKVHLHGLLELPADVVVENERRPNRDPESLGKLFAPPQRDAAPRNRGSLPNRLSPALSAVGGHGLEGLKVVRMGSGSEGGRKVVGARSYRLGDRDAQFALAVKDALGSEDG